MHKNEFNPKPAENVTRQLPDVKHTKIRDTKCVNRATAAVKNFS